MNGWMKDAWQRGRDYEHNARTFFLRLSPAGSSAVADSKCYATLPYIRMGGYTVEKVCGTKRTGRGELGGQVSPQQQVKLSA